MTSSTSWAPSRATLRAGLRRAGPALGLLLLLAGASLVPVRADDPWLRLASPDRSHVIQLQ
ncbi:MAG: hypothetical protein M3P32_04265, partial [Chloroflexota bacterium]|nr:hypothetical protein [Chloroflexota bacterium]